MPGWITSVRADDDGRTLAVGIEADGSRADHVFNRFWLRDVCPSLPTKESGLRTFSVATLPVDLTIAPAAASDDGMRLLVSWSDGHESDYDIVALAALAPQAAGRRPTHSPVVHFDSSFEPRTFSAPELAAGERSHHDLLTAVATDGVALVQGMEGDEATEWLASMLGRIRDTDYGRVFDIVTEPEAWTLSQSSRGQDAHSDDPFRYTPSGISILHCKHAATGDGGRSIIVDGIKIAEDLRAENPDAFRLLCEVSIPYVRRRSESVDQGEDVYMLAYAPVITVDGDPAAPAADVPVVGIRFHERSTGVFDVDPSIVDDYYLAFRAFAEKVRDPAYQFNRRLADGEAIVFDNQRVLHGRTGYESDTAGRRHMRLCTVDRDQVHSRLRRLREVHGIDGVDVTLRSGAASG